MNLCRIYLLAFVYQLTTIATLAALPHTECVRTYTKLGCFQSNNEPLTEFLISDRGPGTDGHKLNWKEWEESIHSLACRCAEAARKRGFKVFGLQNYGECWSGPGAEKTYHLNDPSSECLVTLQKPLPPCDIKDPRECMGRPSVNYMYRLDEDECSKSPCDNGGTCVNTPGGFRCTCSQGFKGDRCDQVVDPCQGNPCQHGGSCQRDGSGFKCKCVTGFIGTHCEKDVDECQTSPCRNGGSCVNNMGSFHCLCPPGIQGRLCEQDINECVPVNPCNNGAHCVNKHGGFQCLCPAGLTGTLCDSDVNECQQLVCLNGATCDNTFGSFHCRCKSGYDGKYCEKKVCSKSAKSGRYDLGLVIDGSGSVGNDGFADTKRFLLHMISQLPVSAEGTHYGIIVYSNDAKIIVRFSERWYHALLPLKLRVLGMEFPDGDTRTDKALKMAGTELYKAGEDRDQVPNVLVVITDGKTAQGSEPYKRVLKPLKDHDVDVIAVGIGDQISLAELTEIAMGKQDRVIQVDKVEDLNITKLSEMIHSIC